LRVLLFLIDQILLEGALAASAQFLLVFEIFNHEADRVTCKGYEDILDCMDCIHQSGLGLCTWLSDLI